MKPSGRLERRRTAAERERKKNRYLILLSVRIEMANYRKFLLRRQDCVLPIPSAEVCTEKARFCCNTDEFTQNEMQKSQTCRKPIARFSR